jgi:hypothetical protein
MISGLAIFVLLFLFLKHCIVDFPLQTPYQWMNKGTYGHFGGVLHSFMHSLFSFIVLAPFFGLIALPVVLVEGIVHYHIDWAKVRLNDHHKWKCNEHPQFWTLLGVDQLLHSWTYILMVWYLM